MKLSVIIPVYNLEKYISATLDSVLNIDFPFEYEIIAVNDGSTDGSRKVIEEYGGRAGNIRLVNIENGGVSNARNVGMEYASGKYIAFVDGDDAVEPYFFKRAVQELEEGEFDFVQTNFKIISNTGNDYLKYTRRDVVISDANDMQERFFGPEKAISNSACGKVFRADLIKDLAFDRTLRIAEDQKFVFDAISASKKIKLLGTVGYLYFQRSESAMHSLDREKAIDIMNVLDYCRSKAASSAVKTKIDAEKLDVLFFVYNNSLINGKDCEDIYKEILSLNPNRLQGAMSRKARVKSALILNARRLYDGLVKARSGR